MDTFGDDVLMGTYRGGMVVLDQDGQMPDGTRLIVRPVRPVGIDAARCDGLVIIAGFGLAGRYIADLLQSVHIPYCVIEKNPVTVETQAALGRRVVLGNVREKETLERAGIRQAGILALTIPDEEAVLQATSIARRVRPDIYIIARTYYSSKGIRASQLGADEVIKAEQAVALQFYERLERYLRKAGRVEDPGA